MHIVRILADGYDEPIEWLRSDVRRNSGALSALSMNMPDVPRAVYAVRADAGVAGVLLCHQFPWGTTAELSVDGPEPVARLVAELDPDSRYQFQIDCRHRRALLDVVDDVTDTAQYVDYSVDDRHIVAIPTSGEARTLTQDDTRITEQFPLPENGNEPSALDFVNRAAEHPDLGRIHGLIVGGRLVSYIAWGASFDPVWEVSMIRTRRNERRKGYARELLSYASRKMLGAGLVPLYYPVDEASRRTCRTVGYLPAHCRYACEAHPRPST